MEEEEEEDLRRGEERVRWRWSTDEMSSGRGISIMSRCCCCCCCLFVVLFVVFEPLFAPLFVALFVALFAALFGRSPNKSPNVPFGYILVSLSLIMSHVLVSLSSSLPSRCALEIALRRARVDEVGCSGGD